MRASWVVKRQSARDCVLVPLTLPSPGLVFQYFLIGNPAVQTLARQHSQFYLGHPIGRLRTGFSQLPCLGV